MSTGIIRNAAIPNAPAFGYLIMIGELLIGELLIASAIIWLFHWEHMPLKRCLPGAAAARGAGRRG